MDKARFLIEVHLETGKPIAELARANGVSRGWLYKLLARYRREGPAGLDPRSRRPRRSPTRISDRYEDEIVMIRKQLSDDGFDAGAETIRYHLAKRHRNAPSVSTIWRALKARGFVTPQPRKRPRSSIIRFVAELPNERWQADVTHVVTAGGVFEVLNIIDDHSRLCVASHAFATTRSADVVRILHKAAEKWGYPETFLTDNGAIFTSGPRGGVGAFESELMSLGIMTKHSRPYHPQTCGKVERFHQTEKKFLARQDDIATKRQLQARLDRFARYYNEVRPHRSLKRHTPLEAFAAQEKARPRAPLIDAPGYKKRHDKIDNSGTVTLRHRGRMHHIGVGRPYAGWRVVLLVKGLEVQIVAKDGSPLRRLILDTAKDYQPIP